MLANNFDLCAVLIAFCAM